MKVCVTPTFVKICLATMAFCAPLTAKAQQAKDPETRATLVRAAVCALRMAYVNDIPDGISEIKNLSRFDWLKLKPNGKILKQTDPEVYLYPRPETRMSTYRKLGKHEITFLILSDQKEIILAFRGTETRKNWNMNGLPWAADFYEVQRNFVIKKDKGAFTFSDSAKDALMIMKVGANALVETQYLQYAEPVQDSNYDDLYVHKGWAAGLEEVWGKVKQGLKAHGIRDKRITITGHSLGGVLAGYSTFRLLKENYLTGDKRHRLITFAAPHYALTNSKGSFTKALEQRIRKQAPNMEVYSVESQGPLGPDYVTLSWDLMAAKKSVVENLRSKLGSGTAILKTFTDAFTPKFSPTSSGVWKMYGAALRCGTPIDIVTKKSGFSDLHDHNNTYFKGMLKLNSQFRWGSEKLLGWPRTPPDEDPKLVAGVGNFHGLTYALYRKNAIVNNKTSTNRILMTIGDTYNLGLTVPGKGQDRFNLGMQTLLPSGQNSKQIVAVGTRLLAGGSGRAIVVYYDNGKYTQSPTVQNKSPSVFTAKPLYATFNGQEVFDYKLPKGYKPADIVGMYFDKYADKGYAYVYFRDGMRSKGDIRDLGKFGLKRYTLPKGYTPNQIVGIVSLKSPDNGTCTYFSDGKMFCGRELHLASLYGPRSYEPGPVSGYAGAFAVKLD